MTSRKATATDDQIREAIAQGKLTCHIMRELRVGAKRINELRGDMPRPALGPPKRSTTPAEPEPEAPIVEPGDEAEPMDEPYEPGPTDTVTVKADYLHALEAVVILTHMLAAAREAA